MATKTKDKTEQKTLAESSANGESRTALALIPPTSLVGVTPISEAEKAFLDES